MYKNHRSAFKANDYKGLNLIKKLNEIHECLDTFKK